MKRKLIFYILLLWLLPAIACNLPTAPAIPPQPEIDIEQAVRQTLAASLFETALPEQTLVPEEEIPPLAGLETPTPVPPPDAQEGPAPGPPSFVPAGDVFTYTTQPGDTPLALARRFGVGHVLDPSIYPPQMLLPSGQMLTIPNELGSLRYGGNLIPDSEIVYSPVTVSFSVDEFVNQAGGFLSTYTEVVDGETLTGAQIVERVAQEMSINPRLLLAFLEYRSNWVFGSPANPNRTAYPIGFNVNQYHGLHKELTLVGRQLTIGYYGWRSGSVIEIEFADRSHQRIYPETNAGTAALQYLFSKLYNPIAWEQELYSPGRFLTFYAENFGNYWQRAALMGPMLPDGLVQPWLELPFVRGETWTLTGGPHLAWGIGSPWGALDFAPPANQRGCAVSPTFATASAPGVVVRSGRAVVLLDLDGDGYEQTGWVLLYMHMASADRAPVGTRLDTDGRVGRPSCEGGVATGTHLHIARKYNGEWIAAEGPLPFVLSGWQAWNGARAYGGSLTRDGQTVHSRQDGPRPITISRD
jgi:LasA protease